MRCGPTVVEVLGSVDGDIVVMWTMYLCSLALDGLVPLITLLWSFSISDSNAKQVSTVPVIAYSGATRSDGY